MTLPDLLQLCHDFKVREYRDADVQLIFADDAFVDVEPAAIMAEMTPEQEERELTR